MDTVTFGSVTLDESAGLQTGSTEPSDPTPDNDVSVSTLQTLASTFYTRLFNSVATGGLGLSAAFATTNGVAESASNFITVSGTDPVTSLGFSQANGSALSTYSGTPTAGVDSGLKTDSGDEIYLFADTTASGGLGNRLVLGYDAKGNVALAVFMAPNASLTQATVWMVQFEALSNPDTTNPDDAVTLDNKLGVAGATSLAFNFNALPSGSNLFGTVGTPTDALIVIGEHPVIDASGKLVSNSSDTIKTSQGGGPTTIGVDNQMFDPGDGAYFTYVQQPVQDFLAGAPNGLTQTEANNANDIQYQGGTLAVTGASTSISQIQGNSLATMRITAYDVSGSPQGIDFANQLSGSTPTPGTPVAILSVTVLDSTGNDVTAGKVSFSGGVATVSGLDAGFTVQWTTSAPHDRVLIEGVAGKFDIGGFALTQVNAISAPVTGLRFEDDGPTITASATGEPTPTTHETDLVASSSSTASGDFSKQFNNTFGTDGPSASTPPAYSFSSVSNITSNLVDSNSGQTVSLASVSSTEIDGTVTINNVSTKVFTVTVDPSSGMVTLTQFRAVKQPSGTLNDDNPLHETIGLTGTSWVVLNETITDGDGDQATAPLDITKQLNFADVGPTISLSGATEPTLTTHETDLVGSPSSSSGAISFAGQFTSNGGPDGAASPGVTYSFTQLNSTLSNLVDSNSGQTVSLASVSSTEIDGTVTINSVSTKVFTVTVDASGNVTLTQFRAVKQPNGTLNDDNPLHETVGLTAANLVVLNAKITDNDGDFATTSLDVTPQLKFADAGPTISLSGATEPTLTTHETDLVGSPSSSSGAISFAGQFTSNGGPDGAASPGVTYSFASLNSTLSNLADSNSGQTVSLASVSSTEIDGTVTINSVSTKVFTVTVDGSGNVTLTQFRAVKQPNGTLNDDNPLHETVGLTAANLVVLNATITDNDGDFATSSLDVTPQLKFADVGPTISAAPNQEPTLTTHETDLVSSPSSTTSANFSGQFTSDGGPDGAANPSTPVAYSFASVSNLASGLTDSKTGGAVTLSSVSATEIDGKDANGDTVFTVTVDATTGLVTLTQLRAVKQPSGTLNDDNPLHETVGLTGSNLVVLSAKITDNDGDFATATLDLTTQLKFADVGPTIGPISDSTVDFTAGATGTAGPVTLNGVLGPDGPAAAAYTIVGYSSPITIPNTNNTQLGGVLSNNNEALTYYADTNNDGIFGDTVNGVADTAFYKLTLGDESGAGSYTFSVLVNPPPAKLTFDLSALASGQNLWGAVADTSKAEGFEVFASNVTLKTDGTELSGGTINTSQGGGPTTIGISNQMFDPGEGAFFTYVTGPLTTGGSKDADDINYNGLFQAHEAQAAISQTQGNTPVELTVKAFEISSPVSPDPTLGRDLINGAGTGTAVAISAVHIFDSTGKEVTGTGGRSFTITGGVADIKGLVAGDTFDWTTGSNHDQVLISDVSGKWDIGAFSIIQTQPTAAQKLPFTVQATDGDGDFAKASFNVNINPVLVS